jgi:hypothetical protein
MELLDLRLPSQHVYNEFLGFAPHFEALSFFVRKRRRGEANTLLPSAL